MKKLKDFLYNWNDIVVILCILIGAVAIIYWRMNMIMDYPKAMALQARESVANNATDENILTPGSSSSTSDEPVPGSGPKNGKLWSGGMLREEITVTTASGSAADAAQSLVDAGLFTSYEDFEAICNAYGFDPTDIKASEFTFLPGTTQAQIVEEVTKPMS